jgi:hypothetical protein
MMNLNPDFVPVYRLAAAAKVSPRSVRRALRRMFPDHGASIRWEIPLRLADAVVDRIKRDRKRRRKNEFNQFNQQETI